MKKIVLTATVILSLYNAALCAGTFAGASLGTPGFINYNMGFYGDTGGITFSVSFLHLIEAMLEDESDDSYVDVEEDTGLSFALLQMNADLILHDSGSTLFALSVAGGTYCFSDKSDPESDITIFYAGPCLHINISGFYTELGVAYGKDFNAKLEEDTTTLLPLIQIGYMGRF